MDAIFLGAQGHSVSCAARVHLVKTVEAAGVYAGTAPRAESCTPGRGAAGRRHFTRPTTRKLSRILRNWRRWSAAPLTRRAEEKYRRIYETCRMFFLCRESRKIHTEMSPQVATLSKGHMREWVSCTHAPYGNAITAGNPGNAARPFQPEIRLFTKMLTDPWFRVRCRRHVRGVGGKMKLPPTWRDITGRSEADREPVDDETRFRSLFEQRFTGIVVVQDQRLVYCNPRTAESLYYVGRKRLSSSSTCQLQNREVLRQQILYPGRVQANKVRQLRVAAQEDGFITPSLTRGHQGTLPPRSWDYSYDCVTFATKDL